MAVINVYLALICQKKQFIYLHTDEENVRQAIYSILPEGLPASDYYIESNGRLVGDGDIVENGRSYSVMLRVCGGKGGFGSMLRALGAQIEKTTNREACRDLSGRRMRDVNNEKRLREWVAKSAEREKAKAERRKERRERMTAAPRYKFDDPQYEQQKANVSENLDDALQEGLLRAGVAGPSTSTAVLGKVPVALGKMPAALGKMPRKRKAHRGSEEDAKKAKEWLGIDDCNLDSDESSTPSVKVVELDYSSSSSSSDECDTRDVECASNAATCDTTYVDNTLDSDASQHSAMSPPPSPADGEPASLDGGPSSCPSESLSSCQDAWVKDTTLVESSMEPSKQPSHSDVVEKPMETGDALDLCVYDTVECLEALGLDVLKTALMARSLKCSGTLRQRAERLYAVRGLQPEQIDAAFFAKPNKRK